MLNGRCNLIILCLCAVLLVTAGCRKGFDQDDAFTRRFRTLFVPSQDTSGIHLTLLDSDGVHPNSETGYGITFGALGGLEIKDNQLWISDISAKTIALWELPSKMLASRGLDITPHILASGDRYVFVADTISRVFRFYRISDLNATPYQDTGKIFSAAINGGKVCLGFKNRIEVWDEYALSRQFSIAQPGYTPVIVYLDAARNFQTQDSDTSGIWFTRADIWAGRSFAPTLMEAATYHRFSWISYRQYQTELLQEVLVARGMLTVGGTDIDSADMAATAFFPGWVWYRRSDSVFLWNGSIRAYVGNDPGSWIGHQEYIDMN